MGFEIFVLYLGLGELTDALSTRRRARVSCRTTQGRRGSVVLARNGVCGSMPTVASSVCGKALRDPLSPITKPRTPLVNSHSASRSSPEAGVTVHPVITPSNVIGR